MAEYLINVSEIEDLQMIGSIVELNQIFTRAQSIIVQGGSVNLIRKNPDGSTYKFNEITTEADIKTYKETVFKYLK